MRDFKIGETVGNVIVKEINKCNRGYNCVCLCSCGETFKCSITAMSQSYHKSCGCKSNSQRLNKLRKKRKQFYGLEILLIKVINRCKRKSIDINLTFDDLLIQWKKQKGLCFYTGVQLELPTNETDKYDEFIASIDRIDSNIGYIPGNIQFVLKDVNFLKWTLSHERFIEMCHLVAKNF